MKTTTITLSDYLETELGVVAGECDLTLDEIVETALLMYLAEVHRHRPPADHGDFRPFWVPVVPEKDDRGEPDVSIDHDRYLAER